MAVHFFGFVLVLIAAIKGKEYALTDSNFSEKRSPHRERVVVMTTVLGSVHTTSIFQENSGKPDIETFTTTHWLLLGTGLSK